MMSKKQPKPASTPSRYRILTDRLTYPDAEGKRIRPGEGAIVDNVPAVSVAWLLEAGAIKSVEQGKEI